MITNCRGCQQELEEAMLYQDNDNLFLATTPDEEHRYPNIKKHFFMMMVNNQGKVIIK